MFCGEKKYEHLAILSNLKKVANLYLQNSDLQSLYMLPIWGFTDYFAWNNSYEPSQH